MVSYDYYCLSNEVSLEKDYSEDLMSHFFCCNLDDERAIELTNYVFLTELPKITWKLEWFNFSLVNEGELFLDFEYGNKKYPELKAGWQLCSWDDVQQGSPSLEARVIHDHTLRSSRPENKRQELWTKQVTTMSYADLIIDCEWWEETKDSMLNILVGEMEALSREFAIDFI